MSTEIKMPALSPTMEHGTLLKWCVSEGTRVARGDILAEIETDKSILEIESPAAGVLARQLFEAKTEEIPVGSVIAVLHDDDTETDVLTGKVSKLEITAEPPSQKVQSVSHAMFKTEIDTHRPFASPLARALARKNNIDWTQLSGSGPNGRVIKRDIERASGPEKSRLSELAFRDIELSSVRRAIANRMQKSKQSVPHFYLSIDVELGSLLKLRQELNSSSENLRLSINDFIIKACAISLKDCPTVNAHFANGMIRHFDNVDIAVATSTGNGLVTPIIRDAHQLTLEQISIAVKELTNKAKAHKLVPEEYQGGTFTVSNLGMFGVDQFAAIINPPQVAILAVGAASERPVVVLNTVVPATVMSLTLSCDHRAIDGHEGAEMLATIKRCLEDPSILQ